MGYKNQFYFSILWEVLQRKMMCPWMYGWNNTLRFQKNMATYQNLITQSMYDKQLDSGRGTLLHLCDSTGSTEYKGFVVA
ncbi:ATP sulfurylase 2 [Iris pallida]|uniref:ATP sulfurylase 2 n=1 Tax=Iris pallida TaxID=29817 RepID=A0AAX6F7Z9_IRIPA|nr:ATP sulfurylase 2 [Iris pallida]